MLWQKSRRSDNVVEDAGGGGGGGGFGGGRGLGLGGIILVVIVSLIFHKNPLEILQLIGGGIDDGGGSAQQQVAPAGNDQQTDFVRAVLGSTEDVWGDMFRASGKQYPAPRLVLFHGAVQSAFGAAGLQKPMPLHVTCAPL